MTRKSYSTGVIVDRKNKLGADAGDDDGVLDETNPACQARSFMTIPVCSGNANTGVSIS
jgi:hypothetical protein